MKGKAASALQKKKVLEEFAKVGTVTHACKETGVSRRTFNYWQKHDKTFMAEYERAQEEAVEALEHEARRRAKDGTLEPVFHRGNAVGAIRRYSDVLLIFLLKAARPEKYRDSYDGGGGRTPHADREETLNSIHSKLARLAAAGDPPARAGQDDGRGDRGPRA
jgi:hypothetical protein